MLIKAQYFKPVKGTVYVVVYSHKDAPKVPQGVFKTLKSANRLKAAMDRCLIMSEVRIGHFNDAGDIETI